MNKQTALSASLSALALSLLMSEAAIAQERQSAVDVLTDEIVVTATKKSNAENVQDVPIAIAAYNADTLQALKVRTLEDLSFSAPNVSLDDIGTTRGSANFSIRGLGVNSSIPSIDPTVGVFVDGVYLGLNSGVVFDLFDLDSVEVLRGPQGILFGRNTTGGAVLINTGNPTDEFEYKARVAVEGPVDSGRGGINSFIQGTVSGPIVPGKLNAKIGGYFNGDSGYFKNLANGENHGEAQTYIGRAALEFTPVDELSFLAKIEYFTNEGDGPTGQNRGLFERDSFDFSIDNEGLTDSESILGSLKMDWDIPFGNGTVTNIFGYRDYEGIASGDIDSTPLSLFHSPTELTQDQLSNELRYNGTFGKANVTTGLYYFKQNVAYTESRIVQQDFGLIAGPGFVPPPQFYGGGAQEHAVYGAFGAVDYSVTEKLMLQLGIRYSKEVKDADITYVRPRPECSVVDSTCPTMGTNPFIPTENNGFKDKDSWKNWSPKVGLQYFITDDAQVYGSWSRGYRSGGYNFRITDANGFEAFFPPGSPRAFDEEKVDSYEIGAKFDSADRRFQLNTAAFYTDITDMQREVNQSDINSGGVLQTILNTADATIKGVEADTRFRVLDSLILTGNVGLIDADYDEVRFDLSGDGVVDGTDLDLKLPRVPSATYGVGFIHDLALSSDTGITTRVNYQHRNRFAYTDSNLGYIQAADIVDANITWDTPVKGVSLALYGKNLLDEVQAGNDTQVPFSGAFSPLVPGSSNLSDPTAGTFSYNPVGGTFSPLKKGRVIGLELTIRG